MHLSRCWLDKQHDRQSESCCPSAAVQSTRYVTPSDVWARVRVTCRSSDRVITVLMAPTFDLA